MTWLARCGWGAIGGLLLIVTASAQPSEHRVALVIGNATYKAAPLRNPVNDARAMAQTLRSMGFALVVLENASRKIMQQGLRQFRNALGPESVGLVYYSGHGMQVKGVNYLIPTDASIQSEAEVEEEAVNLNSLLARLDEAKNRINIVILDACRDNPFERSFRSGSRGLGQVDAPIGTLIAYATAPGSVASDGDGVTGLYTSALLAAIRQPHIPIEEVFKRVRVDVQKRSGQKQIPWEASSLTGNFYFSAPPTIGPAPPTDSETVFWDVIRESNSATAFRTYLDRFPDGQYAAEAKARLNVLLRPNEQSRGAGPAQIVPSEPADGTLPTGRILLVDDHSCPAGQIKEVIGGDARQHIGRAKRCIPDPRQP